LTPQVDNGLTPQSARSDPFDRAAVSAMRLFSDADSVQNSNDE
jgi:hypothetical protein